ncbi:MAG: hypothetical protein U0Y82_11830 [Thermoleophilia bacterium]
MRHIPPTRSLAVACCALCAIAAPALSAVPPTGSQPGALWAAGSGNVVLDGQATVIGYVRGPVTILVKDRSTDPTTAAQLVVAGRSIAATPAVNDPPFVTVRRFRLLRGGRRFILSGQDMRVRITAPSISLSVAGVLKARLLGAGSYTLDSGTPAAWDPLAVVRVGTVPAATRKRVKGGVVPTPPAHTTS